ncbi:MAG: PH domain-containing protein [Gemmataceae bacterium]
MPGLTDVNDQAVTGVTPPQIGEAIIRDVWPSISATPAAGNFARFCYKTIVLAPIAWLALAPLYFKKLLGVGPLAGLAERYRLTNRRLMVCKGLMPVPEKEIALNRIKDVKLITDDNSEFFVSGTLEVIDTDDKTAMTLAGVPEPESVRQSILQAVFAWAGTEELG